MCGIAGIWDRSGKPVGPAALARMAEVLRHRGPDGEGSYLRGELGLAHRRLSILDLTDCGRQPMATPDGRLWLVFNGEIHNYLELRHALERRGVGFRSSGDAEVVLQAYAAWGPECFERFNGMWGLALWDERKEELVLSRDRFGIKPLYVSVRGSRIAFASEVKAILAAFPEERVPDGREIHNFLRMGYPDVGETTFFANVKSLRPATYAVCSRAGVRQATYWGFVPGTEAPRPAAEEEFRDLLRDSVRLRMRSDVPVGACLSGGLDSTSIVRLADPAQPMHCFSLRYDGQSFDESGYAALAAADPGRFIVHWVRPDPARMLETMARIVWHHDAPTPIRGRFPQWFVMREAGRHVKVVLDGQGSDEILAGYTRFILPYIADRLRLGGAPGAVSRLALPAEIADLSKIDKQAKRLLVMGSLIIAGRRLGISRGAHAGVVRREFAECFAGRTPASPLGPPPESANGTRPFRSSLNNALWRELRHAGLTEILHGEDALSMAFSVESRTPFLDHRVVELCFSLPFYEKIADGWTKSLLRRALADVLPEPIRLRRRKLGFPAPVSAWLRRHDNLRAVKELLLDPHTLGRGVFDSTRLEERLRDFGAPAAVRRRRRVEHVWRWITLELWFRQFIDRPSAVLADRDGARLHGSDPSASPAAAVT